MEQIKLGLTNLSKLFSTKNSRNQYADADALPTGTLLKDCVATGATVTVTKLSTGKYKAVWSVLSADGFVKDSVAELNITAAMDGLDISAPIWSAVVETNDVDSLPAAIWTAIASGAYTYGDIMKILAAVSAGKVSGGPGSPVFRDLADTKNVVSGTVDSDGNRSSVTLNP